MEVAMSPAFERLMPSPAASRVSSSEESSSWRRPDAGEVLSGALDLVGHGSSRHVFVRVYRTSREHFAVLLPLRALASACKPLASLNLRTCAILQTSHDEFRVSPRPLEGATLCFKSPPGSPPVAHWIAALQEPRHQRGRCPGSPLLAVHKMPALLEEDNMQPVC